MKKFFLSLAIIVACDSSFAQPLITPDDILKKADLQKLIHNDQALLLIAQLKDSDASTNNIYELNDFIALGTLNDEPTTYITEFDSEQNIIKLSVFAEPWIGLATYQQSEIPMMTLQEGFVQAQACFPNLVSNKIAGVAIYKTLSDGQMVYNFEFKRKGLSKGFCQQVLYSPTANTCQQGMVASCHFDSMSPLKNTK